MIELAKASICIAAPIENVFTYVANMENYKNWFPRVTNIKSVNNIPHGVVGKKYIETLSLPNGEVELEIEVDCSEVNKLFLTKGNLAGILPQMTVKFSVNQDQNCQMDLQYHSRSLDLTPTSDIVIVLKEDLKARANKGMAKLKVIMEQGS